MNRLGLRAALTLRHDTLVLVVVVVWVGRGGSPPASIGAAAAAPPPSGDALHGREPTLAGRWRGCLPSRAAAKLGPSAEEEIINRVALRHIEGQREKQLTAPVVGDKLPRLRTLWKDQRLRLRDESATDISQPKQLVRLQHTGHLAIQVILVLEAVELEHGGIVFRWRDHQRR